MSKNRKRKHIELVKGYKPKPVASSDWEQLAANPTLSGAFRELSVRLSQAQATAEQRAVRSSSGAKAAEYLDFRHALAVLDQHPELLPFIRELQHSERREMLREQTAVKQSPTGAYPQGQSYGMGGWSGPGNKAQGVPNASLLRYYADNNVSVRAAINERRTQMGSAEIAVVLGDPKRKYSRSIKAHLELILDQPNERRQNWSELISSEVEDYLVVGRGAISKNMTVDRKPIGLYAEDAATIKIFADWDGNPDTPRYMYEEPGSARKVPLRNDEIIMPLYNPATYRFSLSPVQVLIDTIKADLEATKQALRMMEQKPPPNAFQIPGASNAQLEALRDAYDRDISGLKELFWFGGPNAAQHFPLVFSAKDNQFLEYQVYLIRKICMAFKISPQQLGISFDVNRSTAETQQQHDEDVGLIPLLLTHEEYLNRELVADYAPQLPYGRYDLYTVNLRVMFPMVSEQARQLHAMESLEMASKGLAGLPALTLNQVLAARGEELVNGGNTFYIKTATGAVPWLSYDNKLGDYTPISTGGALGSQDPSGGPDEDAEDPGFSDDGGADSADSGDDSETSPVDSGDNMGANSGNEGTEKAVWHDTRPFGKRWKPFYMRRVTRKSTDDDLIPAEERKARKQVQAEVKQIFEEAAKRGKQG